MSNDLLQLATFRPTRERTRKLSIAAPTANEENAAQRARKRRAGRPSLGHRTQSYAVQVWHAHDCVLSLDDGHRCGRAREASCICCDVVVVVVVGTVIYYNHNP